MRKNNYIKTLHSFSIPNAEGVQYEELYNKIMGTSLGGKLTGQQMAIVAILMDMSKKQGQDELFEEMKNW